MVLLIELIFFNEPFISMKQYLPFHLYHIIQALVQATFLAMILFFWLVITHSISSNEVINVDETRFYAPKIILCGLIWVTLLISMGYVNLKQASDPSFSWRDDHGSFYSIMQVILIVLFVLYSSYFVIVAYVSFFQGAVRDMKKSYKISLILTFAVIAAFLLLMLSQGYSSSSSPTLYVAFISLLNIYMYVIAFLYAPSYDSLEDLQFKQARKEHEHIMNQFYEQELPDITREHVTEVELKNSGSAPRQEVK
jgi:hypothetical protein